MKILCKKGNLNPLRFFQHYIHNIALLKGFALCMVKNGHEPDLFKSRKTNLLPLPVSAEREARAQYSRFPPPVL